MSASGGFTPPEFPSGTSQGSQDPNGGPPGVSPGVAVAILAGVLTLGILAVFTLGQSTSRGATLVANPGTTETASGYGQATTPKSASSPAAGATSSDPAPAASGGSDGSGGTGAAGDPSASSADTPEFYVGECVDTTGSGTDFSVSAAGCQGADYKIIYSFQDETGDIGNDMAQCYSVDGNDNEFENGDAADGYTLYCMNSLNGDYSPRRADVDNCLDSSATYEVDCTSSKAVWIVIGRLNGTTDTKSCSKFGSYDTSYYWTAAPPFVLCVDRYSH